MDYSKEPVDSRTVADLKVLEKEPFNAEPDLGKLIEHDVTPVNLAYIRNHGPVPKINSDEYRLTIDGFVKSKKTWTLEEMEKEFEKREVVAALQCAGNRRKTMSDTIKEAQGIKWGSGTLINAKWTGYRLLDILASAGIAEEMEQKALHICFSSDAAPTEAEPWYGSSVPVDMALDPLRSVLLATHMNGKPLSPDHGYPLRVIIPGYTGARWVKWLQRIMVSDKESSNHYEQKDYKVLPSDVDSMEKAEKTWKAVPPLNEMPLNSAIGSVHSAKGSPPGIVVKGYAVGDIQAVEVSVDKGKTRHQAKLTYQEGPWSWIVWECNVPLEKMGDGEQEVVVWSRAVAKSGEKQPEECDWNLRGVGYNGVGRWEGKVAL